MKVFQINKILKCLRQLDSPTPNLLQCFLHDGIQTEIRENNQTSLHFY